jgi:hypothetical protein
VINEIHYNPEEGQLGSSRSTTQVRPGALGGGLHGGIRFVFPRRRSSTGTATRSLPDKTELAAQFGLPAASLLGDFSGALDNGGETVTLADARGTIIDELRYDDDLPWDTDADGSGASLERVCADFDSTHPANWKAEKNGGPTPLARNRTVQCPPPEIPPPSVAINEIHYHPLNDQDAKEEYVEIINTTAAPLQLKGYAFTSGIEFIFTEDLLLPPGGTAVVCRDKATMEGTYGVKNTVGNFMGQLSNDGERVSLVDAAGLLADSVRYGDQGDWPVAADGLGYSLEKIIPDALSDDPASWKEAEIADLNEWRRVTVTGVATSSRLLAYLDGAGEFLIDNVSIEDPASPGVNFIPNGTFDTGLEPWVSSGNHTARPGTRRAVRTGAAPCGSSPAAGARASRMESSSTRSRSS